MKRSIKIFCCLICLQALLCHNESIAAEPQAVEISYQQGTRTVAAKIYCSNSKPGLLRRTGGLEVFTPFSLMIKDLKKKKAKTAKITRLKTIQTAGSTACKSLANPQATPTPPAASNNFDNMGNVTAKGKSVFAIPSHLTGNISSGKNLYQAYCSGCHEERLNYTFVQLRSAIKESPMLYDEQQIPDDYLANITAYLNRFRLN